MKRIILITTLLLLISSGKAIAADYKVTCDNTGCTGPTTATFYETNLAPGDSITRTISIKNNYGETLNLTLSADKLINTDDPLLPQVSIEIQGLWGRTRFTSTLAELLTTNLVDLGHLFAFSIREISLTLTLSRFGNTYQASKAWFDIPVSINVQGQARNQGSISTHTSPSSSLPSTLNTLPANLLSSSLGQVAGFASPSADTLVSQNQPSHLLDQLKTYFRWWPWLILFIPILWWIFLLFRSRRVR